MSAGDLTVRLGLDIAALQQQARRAVGDLRQIGEGVDDIELGLDVDAFDREMDGVRQALRQVAGQDAEVGVTADASAAKSELRDLQTIMSRIAGAETIAKAVADTDQALREINELEAELARLDDRDAHIQVRADLAQAKAELTEFRSQLGVVEQESRKAGTAIDRMGIDGKASMHEFAESLSPIPLRMAAIGTAAGVATLGVTRFGRASFDAAAAYNENLNKVDVVFQRSSGAIKTFADDAAEDLGLSESAALSAAGTFGNLFVSMGMGTVAAADMSRGIVQLAADLGSFNNIGTAEALEKIRAGLVGETEPLRTLGVNLSAAAIEAKALEMGLAGTADALTPLMKTQAAYKLILEQTTTAQGDFARTSDSAANRIKTAQASIDDLKVSIGQGLIPMVGAAAEEVHETVRAVDSLIDATGRLTSNLPGGGGGSGWLSQAFGSVQFLRELGTINRELKELADYANDVMGANNFVAGAIHEVNAAQEKQNKAFVEGDGPAQQFATTLEGLSAKWRNVQSNMNRQREAQEDYTESLGRQAEAAGLANERNSAMALGLEMGSEAAAEAAFNLDKLADAAQSAWQGQQNLNAQWQQAGSDVAYWEQNISNAEEALKILDGELEENGQLTAEQQQQYDTLTWALGRYKGGVEDTEGAVVDAGVAHAEFIKRQDELNQLLSDGAIKPAEYARAMADLTAETDPAASSAYNLSGATGDLFGAITDKLVPAIRDLILAMQELDDQAPEPEVDADTSAFDGKMVDVDQGLTDIDGRVVVSEADLDTAGFYSEFDSLPREFTITGVVSITGGPQVGPQAYADGGIIDRPQLAMIGEEAPSHPEFVIPSNPARRSRAMQLWLQAGHTLGVPGFADGGGPAGDLPSKGGTPGGAVSIAVDVQPIDWGFLFADIDMEAEDALDKAADAFIGFFGSIEDLASGDTLARAQTELDRLFTIRQIAVETGLGADVLARIDAQIATQQAEVTAIGTAMGTDVVEGIISATESAEIAKQIIDGIKSDVGTFNLDDLVSGDALLNLQDDVADLEAIRDAMIEAGLPAEALVDINAQIEEGYRKIGLASDLIGTETVQNLIAAAEAERRAAEEAERWAAAIEAVTNDPTGSFVRYEEQITRLNEQIRLAQATGNEALAAQYQEEQNRLIGEQSAYLDLLRQQLAAGLIDEETLLALAEQGGEAFKAFYDSMFGDGALDKVVAGANDLTQAQFDALLAMKPKAEEMGEEWISAVMDGFLAGTMTATQALQLLADETGAITEEAALHLYDLYDVYQNQLVAAMASGEGVEAAQAQWDQYMAMLAQIAAAQGITVDQLIADWEALAAAANQAEVTYERAQGSRSGATDSNPVDTFLTDLVGTTEDRLSSMLANLTDEASTYADEMLALIGDIYTTDLPDGLAELVGEELKDELAALGIDPTSDETKLAEINAKLEQAGLNPITLEEYRAMTASTEEVLRATSDAEIEAISTGAEAVVSSVIGLGDGLGVTVESGMNALNRTVDSLSRGGSRVPGKVGGGEFAPPIIEVNHTSHHYIDGDEVAQAATPRVTAKLMSFTRQLGG